MFEDVSTFVLSDDSNLLITMFTTFTADFG